MSKLMLMLALSAGMAVAACNTVEGAGQDVESVGNAIQNTADD